MVCVYSQPQRPQPERYVIAGHRHPARAARKVVDRRMLGGVRRFFRRRKIVGGGNRFSRQVLTPRPVESTVVRSRPPAPPGQPPAHGGRGARRRCPSGPACGPPRNHTGTRSLYPVPYKTPPARTCPDEKPRARTKNHARPYKPRLSAMVRRSRQPPFLLPIHQPNHPDPTRGPFVIER